MSKPNMFLIAGVNGAGKSTYTKTISKKFTNFIVIDPDTIANSMTGDISRIHEKTVSAGKEALKQVQTCIDRGQSFIIESTISGNVYLRYLSKAKKAGFRTILIYVALPDVETSIKRVQQRVKNGGHNVPAPDIKRRYPKSFENLKNHINSVDLAYIYDNTHHYERIANFRNGMLYKKFYIPEWIKNFL